MRKFSAIVTFLAFIAGTAYADDAELAERLERVEQILEATEQNEENSRSVPDRLPDWTRRFHLSGNADAFYLYGQKNSMADEGRFAVDNARFFFNVDLGGEVRIANRTALRSASLNFEWDLVREASLKNKVGSLNIRFDGIFGIPQLNVKAGRFPLPFGEEYLRFHEQRPSNPLISFSAAAPYNWDEGLLLFGSFHQNRFAYAIAITNGDDDFSGNSNETPQVTVKLTARPFAWLTASVSGTRTGGLGGGDPGESALEWGGTHAEPISNAGVQTFQHGVPIAADPTNRLDDLYAWEADLVFEKRNVGRLWLAGGQAFVESGTGSFYDRDFAYWIAEAIVELGMLAEPLDPFYLALRYSAIGTFDSDKGYHFEAMNDGGNLGNNTKRVDQLSAGVGVRLHKSLIIKAEYSHFDFDVVRGVSAAIKRLSGSRDYGGVAVSVGF